MTPNPELETLKIQLKGALQKHSKSHGLSAVALNGIASFIQDNLIANAYPPLEKEEMELLINVLKNINKINDPQNKHGDTVLMEVKFARDIILLVALGAKIELKNTNGDTPLIWAARNGNAEVANTLISCEASLKAQNYKGETALLRAIKKYNWDLATDINLDPSIVDTPDRDGNTPLMAAVTHGTKDGKNVDTIKSLVRSGANLRQRAKNGDTLLMCAVKAGDIPTIQCLMQFAGANYDQNDKYRYEKGALYDDLLKETDQDGNTVLNWAWKYGKLAVFETLTGSSKDVNINRSKDTPLTWAAKTGNQNEMEAFVRLYDNDPAGLERTLEQRDKYKDTALMSAIKNQHWDAVKYLIEIGADLHAQDQNQRNALDLLAKEKSSSALEILNTIHEAPSQKKYVPLAKRQPVKWNETEDTDADLKPTRDKQRAVSTAEVKSISELEHHYGEHTAPLYQELCDALDNIKLEAAQQFKQRIQSQRSPSPREIEILLNALKDYPNNINAPQNENNDTALMNVTLLETKVAIEDIKLLIALGADVNKTNKHRETAIMLAVRHNLPKEIKSCLSSSVLREKNPSIASEAAVEDLPDVRYDAKTAAQYNQLCKVLEKIEGKTAKQFKQNIQSPPPPSQREIEILLGALKDYPKSIDAPQNANKDTALMLATSLEATEAVASIKLLTSLGADTEKGNKHGETALMYAVRGRHLEAIKALTANNANMDAEIPYNIKDTILGWAYKYGTYDALNTLTGKPIDSRSSNNGDTLLIYMAKFGNVTDYFKSIYVKNIDPDRALEMRNDEDDTALMSAIRNQRWENALELIKLGANLYAINTRTHENLIFDLLAKNGSEPAKALYQALASAGIEQTKYATFKNREKFVKGESFKDAISKLKFAQTIPEKTSAATLESKTAAETQFMPSDETTLQDKIQDLKREIWLFALHNKNIVKGDDYTQQQILTDFIFKLEGIKGRPKRVPSEQEVDILLKALREDDVNAHRGHDQNTALMQVVDLEPQAAVANINLLVALGANIESTNRKGDTALVIAMRNQKTEASLALQTLGAKLPKARGKPPATEAEETPSPPLPPPAPLMLSPKGIQAVKLHVQKQVPKDKPAPTPTPTPKEPETPPSPKQKS